MLRMSGELGRLPWEYAKDEIGIQIVDFMTVVTLLMTRLIKDEIRTQVIEKNISSGRC